MSKHNKRTLTWCFGICVAGVWFTSMSATTLQAQSLFERRSPNQIDPFRDYAARNRGDTLSVLIAESTDVENRDERSNDKSGSSSSTQGFNYGFGGDIGTSTGDANFGHSNTHQRGYEGDTEFRSERQITDRFSVTVTDVLPNGNLVISGTRRISVQGDVRQLRLSGIVRQYDILPNNTVPSYLVANLQLTLDAEGPEQAFTQQGWLSRRFNRWWPF
jgi:flagellar L-ring protein precursor FlgH